MGKNSLSSGFPILSGKRANKIILSHFRAKEKGAALQPLFPFSF